LQISSVGNHEFDEGTTELQRLQRGGCHPTDGCQDGDGFRGAKYPMLAANVVYKQNAEPILKPYVVKKVDGVKVGFVGMTLEGTPSIVNPAGITNVNFLDESQTANRYAQELRRQGVHSLVLLLHEGGFQSASTDPNTCSGFSGPLADIVSRLAPEYGAVVSGHTHTWYACDDELQNSIGDDVLVTSAGSNGRMITDIGITIDKRTKRIVSAEGQNLIVQNSDPALIDATAKTIADKYRTAVAPIANRVVGSISADITNAANPAGESALGDVIADGMLAYTQADGAQLAFMNPGGIRASLIYANSPGGEAPGQVTYGETFTVQPFNNLVATVTLTGAQIKDVLEQQFVGYKGQASTKFLQVSQGFTYSYDTTRALGDRISNIQLNGVALDPAATYRVTTNDFVANGGDGFTTMTAGTDRTTAPGFDVDALAAYLSPGPVAPGPMNRITKLG
jgi:5'-nucleotidase